MNRCFFILTLLFAILLTACSKEDEDFLKPEPEIKKYLHISHTRTNSNPYIDSLAEQLDYTKFDMLWLGGDLAHLTSVDEATITYVDSVFNIGDENTLWALGNHDYSNLNRVTSYTNRSPYYSYHKNGITFIVLDTQDSLSNIIGAQKAFFESVVDTMQQSSHLIVLHHKLFWMYGDTYLESQISAVANGGLGSCFYCINPNNFYQDIYPKLVEVKQKDLKTKFDY